MSARAVALTVIVAVVASIVVTGCAVPAGGCPYCGYPPGTTLDGETVTCQRCGGSFKVYMNGSVATMTPPTRQVAPVSTNNSKQAQKNLENGLGMMLFGLGSAARGR